jgi:hypothetical protein
MLGRTVAFGRSPRPLRNRLLLHLDTADRPCCRGREASLDLGPNPAGPLIGFGLGRVPIPIQTNKASEPRDDPASRAAELLERGEASSPDRDHAHEQCQRCKCGRFLDNSSDHRTLPPCGTQSEHCTLFVLESTGSAPQGKFRQRCREMDFCSFWGVEGI